ncbi:MAG: UbiA family prenyltransferase, partial [Chloroflexota bacterium]
ILFVLSAAAISMICFLYSFPVLLILFSYSFTKRFTWLSHLALGFAQALNPLGVWLAVTGGFSLKISVLAMTLGTYMVGLDLIYACQDVEFDRREGLKSVPVRFGVPLALRLAQLCHALTVISLGAVGAWFGLGWPFWAGLAIIAALFVWEHSLVKPDDLSKVDMAFFNVNGYISLAIFAAVVLAVWIV